MLKLKEGETEFSFFSPKQHVKKTENLYIKVGSRSSDINSSVFVRIRRLMLDNTLGKEKQMNS